MPTEYRLYESKLNPNHKYFAIRFSEKYFNDSLDLRRVIDISLVLDKDLKFERNHYAVNGKAVYEGDYILIDSRTQATRVVREDYIEDYLKPCVEQYEELVVPERKSEVPVHMENRNFWARTSAALNSYVKKVFKLTKLPKWKKALRTAK